MKAVDELKHVFQNEFIGNQSDKFGVGRLFRADINSRPKNGIDRVDATSVPRHFDGMANRSFHFARTRFELFTDFRVQFLRHVVDDGRLHHRHFE